MVALVARFVQGFANALTQPSSQSIILIFYSGNLTKAISLIEISSAIGAASGPFFGSSLNLVFGYEGPFIAFALVYIVMLFLLYNYIPSDQEMVDLSQQSKTISTNFSAPKQFYKTEMNNDS